MIETAQNTHRDIASQSLREMSSSR